MDITTFNFKKYYLNKNMHSLVGSVFYDKVDEEDSWIEIVPDANLKDTYIFITVFGGETVRVEALNCPTKEDYERWIDSLL